MGQRRTEQITSYAWSQQEQPPETNVVDNDSNTYEINYAELRNVDEHHPHWTFAAGGQKKRLGSRGWTHIVAREKETGCSCFFCVELE